MPTQDLPELDSEQISRITQMATAARYLKKRGNIDTQAIFQDVNMDFARTMNLIIMEKTMEKTEEELKEMIPANLSMPPKAPVKEVPYFGMVPIPPHDFPEQFSNFCFNSLYSKEEVIRAMVEIRAECNNLLQDNKIFDVSVNKTLRVEEFKQIQSSSIA
jgi:dynein heavy chain